MARFSNICDVLWEAAWHVSIHTGILFLRLKSFYHEWKKEKMERKSGCSKQVDCQLVSQPHTHTHTMLLMLTREFALPHYYVNDTATTSSACLSEENQA